MNNKEFEKLEHSIIDVIKEEQAKLGYQKEDIRLYYPLSSLNHFFESNDDADAMQTRLADFPIYTEANLGSVGITHKKNRFCFYIPEQGAVYVHEHTKENEFIKELIELVGKHGCSMEEVQNLFKSQGKPIHMEETTHGEFDILIYFEEDEEDPYYYCFKDEGCHIIYHRFLPADYEDFEF